MDELEKSLRRILNQGVRAFCDQILDQIVEAYSTAIERFYADYRPYKYARTGSLFKGSDVARGDSTGIKKTGNGYQVGIIVSADYGNPYRANDAEWVFERAFSKGIHGWTRNQAIEWNARWRQQGNSFRLPVNVFHGQKRISKPSPQTLMNKSFRKISSKSHLDSLVSIVFSFK